MEIPEINMISDFEAGMKCLQNPSLISRFFSFQVFSFWKWGALFFAIFATFSSIIRRIKLIFIRFHTVKPSSHHKEEIVEFSEDDDISLASSDDEEDERENRPTTSFRGQHRGDEADFSLKGSCFPFRNQWLNGHLRQRRRRSCGGAWSEFTSGKNVVKLWDSIGLSLDFDEDLFNYESNSVVSTWEFDHQRGTSESSGGLWNIPVVLTAESNGNGDGVILEGYDTRMRRRVPALYAEWSSPADKVAGVSTDGAGKVYLRDDVDGVVTVGDVRNIRRPFETVREADGDTWWDADAVIVEDEFVESR